MSPKNDGARATILVVDDCIAILKLIATILSDGPYETIEVASAREAIEIALRNRIDLLISDVDMPDMGGAELLGSLKASGAVTCCILISGQSMNELREAYRVDPLVRFLAKPFGATQFLHEVESLLES